MSPRSWALDEDGLHLLEKTRWLVTEKTHGSSFCFNRLTGQRLDSAISKIGQGHPHDSRRARRIFCTMM